MKKTIFLSIIISLTFIFYGCDSGYSTLLSTETPRGEKVTEAVSEEPTPTAIPTPVPTPETTPEPTPEPTQEPTPEPTAEPTTEPVVQSTPATSVVSDDSSTGRVVYDTPTGKKYHFSQSCAGKNAIETTLDKVLKEPCQKCAY